MRNGEDSEMRHWRGALMFVRYRPYRGMSQLLLYAQPKGACYHYVFTGKSKIATTFDGAKRQGGHDFKRYVFLSLL